MTREIRHVFIFSFKLSCNGHVEECSVKETLALHPDKRSFPKRVLVRILFTKMGGFKNIY